MPPKVSLCLIVKNEEDNLPACLASVAGLFDEIVVVDTGSTDRTKEIARRAGAKVFDFPWRDDFSAARNETLRHASGEWIFWMDADDRIEGDNRTKLKAILDNLPREDTAFLMRCISVAPDGTSVLSFVDHPRLFRKQPGVAWRYRVHEQVLPSILKAGGQMQKADVLIRHGGYQDATVRRRKDERNLHMLRLDARDCPDDHAVLFHLGMTLVVLGQAAEAIAPLRRSLERAHPQDPTIRKTFTLLTQAHRKLNQNEEALAVCQEGLRRFPDDTELLFQEAVMRIYRGDLAGGERCLRRLLSTPPGDYIAVAVDPELRGVKARFNLGVVCRDLGRPAEAEAEWKRVVAEKPDFTEAWIGLADLYLGQGRHGEAEALLRHLRADASRAAEADSVEARCLLARGDFAGARRTFERAIARAPQSVGPMLALVQVLIAEGKDWAAAEKVVNDILTLEPNNTQGRLHLETIRRRRQQPARPAAGRPRVSLTMIVKNEEASLGPCLKSAEGLFDEIVVVDTGSTDRTMEIALQAGAKVFDFPWRDDFSAARNETLKHATGDWIFWLDADEQLDEEARRRLRDLLGSLKMDNVAYAMKQLCVKHAPLPGMPGGDTIVEQVRLYRRLPGIAWEHRVFEQILPSVRQLGGELRHADIFIRHGGYQDPADLRRKLERNLRLAQMEYVERPDDPYTLFQLGLFHQQLGRPTESVTFLGRAVERCPPSANYAAKLHGLLAQGLDMLGRRGDALAACRRGRATHPADAELLCQEAGFLATMGDLDGAVQRLRQVLPGPTGQAAVPADPAKRLWARHQLALIARQRGRVAEAETYWQAALTEQPDFAVAWLELAELYLAQQRWSDVEAIARRVEGPLGRPDDAAVLRSRVLLFRREFAPARTLLEETIRNYPQAIRPRQALTHVLLHEGSDLAAAERSLRELLTLDPGNANARGNLDALLRRRRADAPPRRQRVSLTMIVRNEQAHLPACLASVIGLVDEMVVVDTGSTDRTKEIAARFGAKVYDFPWRDDFAAARNEALSRATGDWVLWLDADDRIDADNQRKLEALFASLGDELGVYMMHCVCQADPTGGAASVVDHARLFRRHPQVRWEYRVHEQILPAVQRAGGKVHNTDVAIRHEGYEDAGVRRHKNERNLRLLEMDRAARPSDPVVLFNLGWVYQKLGRPADAVPVLRRALEKMPGNLSVRPKLYVVLARSLRQAGQVQEAAAVCREGLAAHPEEDELLFEGAQALHDLGDLGGAEVNLRGLQQLAASAGPGRLTAAGVHGCKARHHLALLWRDGGRTAEAEAAWKALLDELPGFTNAWVALGDLYLAEQRWDDLDTLVRRLEADPQRAIDGVVLRARGLMARREFTQARKILEDVIAREPRALWPRVALSHVLLTEGRDWPAAARALDDVLALEPAHTEARHNRALLQGKL
jgi:glycosyltransferase involved in cell wall biosynthesis/Tfp pilus assembly protein PilF